MQLHYPDKLHLVALTQQVKYGAFSEDKVPPLGALDVIGKDRRNAWAALGELSADEARRKFVSEARRLMPHLAPYLEAHIKSRINGNHG